MPRIVVFRLSSSRHTATPKCGCRHCALARWNSWPNRLTMKRCSKAFERPWTAEPISAPHQEISVEAFDRIGSDNRDRGTRKFEQLIGNSPALESVLENVERVASTGSTVLI